MSVDKFGRHQLQLQLQQQQQQQTSTMLSEDFVKSLIDDKIKNLTLIIESIVDNKLTTTSILDKSDVESLMDSKLTNIIPSLEKMLKDLHDRLIVIEKQPKIIESHSTDFIALEGTLTANPYKQNDYHVQLSSGLTEFKVPLDLTIKSIAFIFPSTLTLYIDGKKLNNPLINIIGKKFKKGQSIIITHSRPGSVGQRSLVTLLINLPLNN